MRMPALYISIVAAALVAIADYQEWPALAVLGLLFAAAFAITFVAEKRGIAYVAGVGSVLITCDALVRYFSTELGPMHRSITLPEVIHGTVIAVAIGWIGGTLFRNPQSDPSKTPMLQPEAVSVRRSPFAAPERARRNPVQHSA